MAAEYKTKGDYRDPLIPGLCDFLISLAIFVLMSTFEYSANCRCRASAWLLMSVAATALVMPAVVMRDCATALTRSANVAILLAFQ